MNPRDSSRHAILSTTSMRPVDFAVQLNVSLANGWGIVRTITDLCMKMPEGKYVLVKDPNKVSILYKSHDGFHTPTIRSLRVHVYSVSVHVWDSDADRTSSLQPMVRLYSVPFNAFTGEDEDEAEAIEEADEESGN